MRIHRMAAWLPFAVILSPGCAITPENVCSHGEVDILVREDWYRGMESIPVETFIGTLSFQPPDPVIRGRYYAFALDDVNVFVTEAKLIELMQNWVGHTVIIRGKITNVGFGPEVWPGSITCLDENDQQRAHPGDDDAAGAVDR